MNENDKNIEIEKMLEDASQGLQPNLVFKANLEEKLRKAHRPHKGFLPNFATNESHRGIALANLYQTLLGITVLGGLIFFMLWLFQSFNPQGSVGSSADFVCPVTPPNGSVPPSEQESTPNYYLGNGELWTELWPAGKIVMEDFNLEADGSYSMKWAYVRGVPGALTVEGRRLDADAEPLRAFINDGYGDSGLQVLALTFPTSGCWEVTAKVGESSLTFITEVVLGESITNPIVVPNGISTPIIALTAQSESVQKDGIPWRGTTLTLNAELPQTPASMGLYRIQPQTPATLEEARALAQKFEMKGDIYLQKDQALGTDNYLIVDGNRQLFVQSKNLYHYVPNLSAYVNNPFFTKYENAENVISEFMQKYGLGGDFIVEYSDQFNGYYAIPRNLNGLPLSLGYFTPSGYLFRFTQEGLLGVESRIVESTESGSASIISAEEAWQRVLNNTDGMGMQESMISTPITDVQSWARPRLLNQTVTVFGYLSSTGKSVDGNPALITLDAISVIGNTAGIADNLPNTFVEATGQFTQVNDARLFQLETWSLYNGYEEGIQGEITREGDSVFISIPEGPKLNLPDFPNEIQLPNDALFLTGVTRGNSFEWKTIDNRPMGGGGGGGGGGFYKINTSGTPVPFPAPGELPTQEAVFTQEPFEALRGIVTVNIYQQSDGTTRATYTFMSNSTEVSNPYLVLEGQGLEELQKYNNRPIDIWGKIDRIDENGLAYGMVDRFEIPYPDLTFEVLKGVTQKELINGNSVLIFVTEDNRTFTISYPDGNHTDDIGMPEDTPILLETLAIPGEEYEGIPMLRIFGSGIALNPTTGKEMEMPILADKPNVIPDNPSAPNTTLDASIDKIELAYYIADPRNSNQDQPDYLQIIQPVWRFLGHYSDGTQFEILVQALTEEFLIPEPDYYFVSPG